MRLLRTDGDDLVLEAVDDGSQKYAILSHRWLAAEEEVTYADIVNRDSNIKQKLGFQKLSWCRQQAIRDGFQYIWADTACIDKSSSQELTESINSMYRWYENAEVCYVYLYDMPDRGSGVQLQKNTPVADISASVKEQAKQQTSEVEALANPTCNGSAQITHGSDESHDNTKFSEGFNGEGQTPKTKQLSSTVESSHLESLLHGQQLPELSRPEFTPFSLDSSDLRGWSEEAFASSEWFTRAWTLQELIAPRVLKFYSRSWSLIGELQEIAPAVAKITGIHLEVLTKQRPLTAYSIAQKMSWAAGRRSTKIEDKAYSLLGIMDIAMGVVYGEGPRAFQRLQEELLRSSTDDSLFAFGRTERVVSVRELKASTLLAESPDDFRECRNISLTRWHGGKNQYQTFSKEVSLRMRLLKNDTIMSARWKSLRWLGYDNPEIFYRRAILDCSLEQSPSTMLVLRLFAFPEQPTTFYINGDGPRVEKLRFWDSRNYKHAYEDFSVVKNPDEFETSTTKTMMIICGFKRSDLSVQLVEVSLPDVWNATDTTFVLPDEKTPLEAEINVLRERTSLGTLYICSKCQPDIHLSAKFKGRSVNIPAWATLVLHHDLHYCALKRVSGGFLVARVYQHKRFPETSHFPFYRSSIWEYHRPLGFCFAESCFQALLSPLPIYTS